MTDVAMTALLSHRSTYINWKLGTSIFFEISDWIERTVTNTTRWNLCCETWSVTLLEFQRQEFGSVTDQQRQPLLRDQRWWTLQIVVDLARKRQKKIRDSSIEFFFDSFEVFHQFPWTYIKVFYWTFLPVEGTMSTIHRCSSRWYRNTIASQSFVSSSLQRPAQVNRHS